MNRILGQRVNSAICADDILPEGQAVVVRIPTGNRTSTNPPAVVIRYYRSVASKSPPTGDDGWAGKRFISCASRPFFPRTRGTYRGLNLFGPLQAARRFICSLRQFRQEPRSVFAVSFRPGPFVALAHEKQRNERSLSWVTRNMLRVTKCL